MSMMDLQAALGGQGGPPQGGPPMGGPPPELAGALLPGGPEGAPVPGEEQPESSGSSLDHLLDAEEALQTFIQVDPDDADRAEATKALQIIIKLKAANNQDAREGGMKSLTRALSGGA